MGFDEESQEYQRKAVRTRSVVTVLFWSLRGEALALRKSVSRSRSPVLAMPERGLAILVDLHWWHEDRIIAGAPGTGVRERHALLCRAIGAILGAPDPILKRRDQ